MTMTTPPNFSVTTGPLPASKKIYVAGCRYPDLRIAMREIALSADEPGVRSYDPSGPYTDPTASIDIRDGLPALRQSWIEGRGDVETYAGRTHGNPRNRILSSFPDGASAHFARSRENASRNFTTPEPAR